MLENLMKKQNLFSNEKDIERLRVKSSQYYAKDMKMKSDFVVPISHQMLEVLESVKPLSCASVYVFPSDISKTKQMSENTLNYAIKRMGDLERKWFFMDLELQLQPYCMRILQTIRLLVKL